MMSTEAIQIHPLDSDRERNPTVLYSTTDSESDGGYGTPAEHFADDENDHPLAPPTGSAPATKAESTATDAIIAVDPELQERIVTQVEWYFSDDNLLKDSFLMKHINRNKQGYVSLKLVASMRKVKSLTKDWRVVLASMKHSSFLALNEEGTKIRRISAAPLIDYSHIARTVIATNYPDGEPNAKNIEETFSKFGEVTLVRILQPGKAVPLDVKPCKSHHPNLGKELCILVEFESEGGAKIAYQRFKEQQSWRDDMTVEFLDKKIDSQAHSHAEGSPKPTESRKNNRHKQKSEKKVNSSTIRSESRHRENLPSRFSKENSPSRFSRENSPVKQSPRKYSPPHAYAHSDNDAHRWKSSVRCSPELINKFLHPDAWKDYASDSGYSCGRSPSESPKASPEPVKRRFFTAEHGSSTSWRTNQKHLHARESGVIRQPLGPDGTRGFHRPIQTVRVSVDSC